MRCRYRGGSGDLRMDRKTDKEKERPRLAKTTIQDLEALIDSAIDRNLSSKTSKSVAKESKGANDINENLEGIVDRMSGVQIGKDNITEDQEGKGGFLDFIREHTIKTLAGIGQLFKSALWV